MKVNSFSLWIACILVALLAAGCLPHDPPLNSAITAHGNTDWHIDTANEFLFGVDNSGNPSAANHCPDTWSRQHMHVGLTNTANSYYDSGITATGVDTDAATGIDTAMLFFYAGHGSPTSWDTLGNNASQGNMRLSNYPGQLRYYWQCSCEVFAHGPQTCSGSTHDYSCPGSFDGSADSASMRNVYERWGRVLGSDLRMACGASTEAYCHETQTDRIWDDYNNKSYDVADSFIDGLHGTSWVVPLCIAKGGSDVAKTPLYDTTFTNTANIAGTSYYHIEYLSNFASTPISPSLIIHIPELLPILKVKPLPLPGPLRDVKFETKANLLLSSDRVGDRGPRVRVDRLSGAVYILGERKLAVEKPALEEKQYIERALRFVEAQGWAEKNWSEPMGVRFMIESVPVEGERDKAQQFQKNVIVTLKRQIDVDGVLVNVLGEGGTMAVQMNNDGSVLNASKIWREVVDAKQQVRVKTYEEAYAEALKQLRNPQAYKLDQWTWGYEEAAGNVEQTELRIVFHFWFVPADRKTLLEYPPQMIKIPGQLQ